MEQTDSLHNIRHSLAHLLAIAVLEKDPSAKLGIGPVIDNGFYYDFEFSNGYTPTPEDLKGFEKAMRKMVNKGLLFEGREVSVDDAKKIFAGQPYKLDLINELEGEGKNLTIYKTGEFEDLCKGGHVENTKEIPADAFTITHTAGAYWRGSEKNQMLTRIYGLAFESGEALDSYKKQLEEARKRDHRKLGKELELFTIVDEIGAGLPLFYPKGALLRKTIEHFISEQQKKRGYQDIWIPHITKGTLYEISGHLDKYDAMYTPMKIDEHDYYVKPMNCPHFMMLYKTLQHSYKELPVRYTCTTTNYRYEKSGELSGLTRVRSLTQDDCHVFTRPDQIEEEIDLMLDMIKEVYAGFGLSDFYVRISLRDSKNKDKYIGSDDVWDTAENALRGIVKKTGWKYEEAEDEAAFYGPKLDFMFKDAIGRQWQLSTIQLDFNLPERFDLNYIDEANEKIRPVVIHRAVLGSTERFMGVMIEHFAGNFPLWLSPVQVKILPISEKYVEYAEKVRAELANADIRVELDDSNESLGKRIRIAKTEKVPYILVLGEKEVEVGTVTAERRDGAHLDAVALDVFISTITKEITTKEIW
ncbi:MAG: Ser-tRNA(Thr) hydrolase/threonyl-tRNA synthetase, threonyl-tRNA synthetase [Parcubacteria group bacterium GW2011_GWC1_42_11]|uniref:Threonine--tRNA ligase n=1 Tax=Candidatus Nomurabacteria bacterium GW2011_GWC2_42_20 TaxID=1618756 RepID=A0A0G1CBU3_9BACT|nr:MAG: Ser-tRNA(Thr) hydrolase/threonyl-tRNA synthetase, threonyl-tRNA synthetase [Parcubacteria group bacterium GW2011_GWC1_42_11]KKS47093.1 MAG: Threonine-tRNA ligase [Candidatus Nomurabacteria bacterium GW2011_GWC2_42_20]KKT08285.1 MAG: Threonine-tRNA ligase [Candidatus Nomurabacteria bacterium GW2011_GWB1_43_20]